MNPDAHVISMALGALPLATAYLSSLCLYFPGYKKQVEGSSLVQ